MTLGITKNLASLRLLKQALSARKYTDAQNGAGFVKRMMDEEPSVGKIKEAFQFFQGDCRFLTSAATKAQLDDIANQNLFPQVAIAGRSNVGKSSLINALLGKKQMALVSKTPGRTQTINFFNLNDQLMLVDLPGYGYAKAPTDASYRWNTLTSHYLTSPYRLLRLFLLIDSRVGLKAIDYDFLHFVSKNSIPTKVVLTKIDKLTPNEAGEVFAKIHQEVRQYLNCILPVRPVSSLKHLGIDELRAEIFLSLDKPLEIPVIQSRKPK